MTPTATGIQAAVRIAGRHPLRLNSLRSLVLIALLGQGGLQAAQAENLIDVYRKAVTMDARYAASQGSYQAGVEKLSQGRSQLLPSLNLNGEKMYSDSEITYESTSPFESGTRSYEDLKYSATLTQPLYRKQNFAAYSQGKAQKKAAEAQFAFAEQDLILRVAQAYFDLLSAQQNLAAAQANAASLKAQDHRARIQLTLGAGSRLEASEARSKYEVSRAQEIAARHEMINKQQALRRITSEAPGTLEELRPDFPLALPEPDDIEFWINAARLENAQLKSLRASMKAAKQEVERAKGGHYPNIDLVAQYSNNDSTGSVYTSAASETVIKSAGVRVEMSLFQGGIVNSRVREAHGMLEKARGELEDAEREVIAQVTQSFNGSVNSIEQVRALEQARISSLEAARATRIGLEIGTRNLVDLLNAEQQVYDIAREYTKARQEYVMSRLRLLAIAGRLAEADLQALNDYLAPPVASTPLPPPAPKPLPAEMEEAVIPDDGGLTPTPILPKGSN